MARSILSSKIEYIRDNFAVEDLELIKTRLSAPPKTSKMQIGPDEGKLIYMLLKLKGAKTVIELGTYVGYSTLWIAKALPEDGHIISVESSKEHFDLASENLYSYISRSKIKLINDTALDFLHSFNQKVDAIFIDANKADYPHYLDFATKILHKGGLLIADNVFLSGEVYDAGKENPIRRTQGMKQFNEQLSKSNEFESIIIPTDEGLMVAQKC